MNKYTFDEIKVGMKEEFTAKITKKDMDAFCWITGDINPLHCNKEYAVSQGFEEQVVYGLLTTAYFSTLAGVYLPGEKSLIQNVDVNFVKPVYINEQLYIIGEVIDKNELFKILKLKITIKNSKSEKVVRGKMQVGVLD